jgi:hypothetical protein
MKNKVDYMTKAEAKAWRAECREFIARDIGKWAFCHSVMMRIVENQDGASYASHKHGDGVYDMKTFDLNPAASWLAVALDEWEK